MAGEGKTTLAREFLRWLEDTNGLGEEPFWHRFSDGEGISTMFNSLEMRFLQTNELALDPAKRRSLLVDRLRKRRLMIVWDNFESISGTAGASLSQEDRDRLKGFLMGLRGSRTKVLITSRSSEAWFAAQECFPMPLEGLEGEDLWRYCNAVLADIDKTSVLDRESATYQDLMRELGGNPLAVRSILLRLKDTSPKALLAELKEAFNGLEGDEATKRIQAALTVFGKRLDPAFGSVLRLLGLHEQFAVTNYIKTMLEKTGEVAPVAACFAALESGGLCSHIGSNVYRLHPALRAGLSRLRPAEEADQRAFVEVMGRLADAYVDKELHEQRVVFLIFGANFHHALTLAEDLGMQTDVLALTQGLASYAQKARDFDEAERMFAQLSQKAREYGLLLFVGISYHYMGIIAQERQDFEAAKRWCAKSLEIFLKLGNEHNVAYIYHELGVIAQERRDFDAAERWYAKALEIFLKLGNEHGAAITYHNLGVVTQRRRDFDAAERWYTKALEIKLKQGDEHRTASTYHQLGSVAEERGELDTAQAWYEKALAIFERFHDEYHQAIAVRSLAHLQEQRKGG